VYFLNVRLRIGLGWSWEVVGVELGGGGGGVGRWWGCLRPANYVGVQTPTELFRPKFVSGI